MPPESVVKTDATYPPLNTLKPVGDHLWIVDGPIIRFGPRWLKIPFPTRMTIIRLSGNRLLIHSPTPLTATLAENIARIGTPRWIIGPNRLHYWWVTEWHAAYPEADTYLAPRIQEQAGSRINFTAVPIEPERGLPWDGEVATLAIEGRYLTEIALFHRADRTLILTDLIENFERQKLSFRMRWLTWLGHVQDPDGQTPRDMRVTFAKPELRAAVETMIGWDPERVIIAHGRWYDRNGTEELRRAFRWLLAPPR
jgi:hypothetical protein